MLFKKKPVNVKAMLFAELKYALKQYTEALQNYGNIIRDFNSGSAVANYAMAELEMHRESYFQLRVQYEETYGDIEGYQEKLNQFKSWSKEAKCKCLFKQPLNLQMSSLA